MYLAPLGLKTNDMQFFQMAAPSADVLSPAGAETNNLYMFQMATPSAGVLRPAGAEKIEYVPCLSEIVMNKIVSKKAPKGQNIIAAGGARRHHCRVQKP
jgi:hypothetical protein